MSHTTPATIIPYDTTFQDAYAAFLAAHPSKRVVLVGGCFDLLHIGHMSFLKQAADEGDLVVLALESDGFIKATKHRAPVHTQEMRAQILAGCRYVDLVITMPYLTSHDQYDAMVRVLAPHVIAVTAGDPALTHKKRQADMLNIEVKPVVDLVTNFSTTHILNEIISRD